MANLINLERVSKSYGVRPLLDNVSLGISLGERVGVVGRNGDGKTTLLAVMTGIEAPDSGRVSRNRGVEIGYLHQGDELVALSLVDPDNRRPVDWERRALLLAELRDGAAPMTADARKLFLVRALLALRARRAAAFDGGGYTPLDAGPDAVAFLRGDDVAVAMPIREGGLDMDLLALPDGEWRPAFDPELLPGASVHLLERH